MGNINVLIKPSSSMCNIRCKYCFYRDEAENRETKSFGFMKLDTLEEVIKKSIEFCDTECTIAYQGGEPTMSGLDFFKKSIEFQNKYNTRNIKINNAIQTNGVNLSDEFIQFLKDNNFLVGISLDGIKQTHDCFRVDCEGNGTYKRVVDTIKKFNEIGVEYNVLTVVNAKTAKNIEKIYKSYKELGVQYMQFIPCLNPLDEPKERYEHTLNSKEHANFLKKLFDMWYKDVTTGNEIHVEEFENYVGMLMGRHPGICGMSGICSNQFVVESDGSVYPCDFYALDQYKIGNMITDSISDIDNKRKEIKFVEESLTLSSKCPKCKYIYMCRGGCKRQRTVKDKDGVNKYRLCEAYYEFFDYSITRLKKLAEMVMARNRM